MKVFLPNGKTCEDTQKPAWKDVQKRISPETQITKVVYSFLLIFNCEKPFSILFFNKP
jgi:hypothetical protein